MDQTLNGMLPAIKARNQVPGSFDALAYVENFEPYTEASKGQIKYNPPGELRRLSGVCPQGRQLQFGHHG